MPLPPPLVAPWRRALGALAGQAVPLAALAVCAGGLLGFAALLGSLQGEPHRFDTAVLLALRRPDAPADPIGPPWLEQAMRDITALGGMTVLSLAGLVALGWFVMARRWRPVALLVLSLPGGIVLNTLLKQGFDRPRPDLVAHLVDIQTASFPSGHAMLATAGYVTLGALLAGSAQRRRGYILGVATALALLVGISRVYLGVHWPTDVLAGWCLGASWAMACWLVLRLAPRRGRREDATEAG